MNDSGSNSFLSKDLFECGASSSGGTQLPGSAGCHSSKVVEACARPRRRGGDADRRRYSIREQRGTSQGARTATGVAENREPLDLRGEPQPGRRRTRLRLRSRRYEAEPRSLVGHSRSNACPENARPRTVARAGHQCWACRHATKRPTHQDRPVRPTSYACRTRPSVVVRSTSRMIDFYHRLTETNHPAVTRPACER